jgi:hypothetical protein
MIVCSPINDAAEKLLGRSPSITTAKVKRKNKPICLHLCRKMHWKPSLYYITATLLFFRHCRHIDPTFYSLNVECLWTTCINLTSFVCKILLTVDYIVNVLFRHKNIFDKKCFRKFCLETDFYDTTVSRYPVCKNVKKKRKRNVWSLTRLQNIFQFPKKMWISF